MKTIILIGFTLLSTYAFSQYNDENLKIVNDSENIEQFSFKKIRIYPIQANDVFQNTFKDLGKYTNLENAIKENKVIISEVSDSGSVNTLYAKNTSKKTIYIMAGEVVKGGKQDRIVGQDIVLAPGESKNINAFCVEHGRWQKKESGNNFIGYMNVSSKSIRKAAVVNKNQSLVWEKVAEITQENKAGSSTGTYTALENSETYNIEMKEYLTKFKSVWNKDSKVVGVIAVTGNEVIGCDIFATHDLFVNAYNNLIHSYITEALTNGKEVTISNNKVQKYLDQFLKDETKQEENLKGNGDIFNYNGKKMHISKF